MKHELAKLNKTMAQSYLEVQLIVLALNAKIKALVEKNFTVAFPHTKIVLYDSFSFIKQILTDPGSYNISNSLSNCMVSDPPFSYLELDAKLVSICSNPDKFVFWDGLHPTSKVQELLAKSIVSLFAHHGILPYDWQHFDP